MHRYLVPPGYRRAAPIRCLKLDGFTDLIDQWLNRWPLAGDQFFVDLDLGRENLPAGTWLAMGAAIVEMTSVPHLGCRKFAARFGLEAMKFVNSRRGRKAVSAGDQRQSARAGSCRHGRQDSKGVARISLNGNE